MEHPEMDDSRWVDERLSSLDPAADWRPDASAALARWQRRAGVSASAGSRRWRLWATLSATAAAGFAAFLLLSTSPVCANPLGCSQPVRPAPAPAPAPVSVAVERHAPARQPFKESGSTAAPVTCELFTDYECPFCATFYLQTVPQLEAAYVDTGKVRLVHRDFPLPRHRYALMAARYANAAGEAGYYQAAAQGLFRTQAVWSADGNIDGQVARVVPPGAMEKVRALANGDPAVEDSIKADEAAGREDHVERTPTLVCNHQALTGPLGFVEIQPQIDRLLGQR
jgi:protein-disulfide isomerase